MSANCNLGWYLATCPDDKLRDGEEARARAYTACEGSNWRDPKDLDVVAAAYAECGQFEDAVKWQTKALELARESNKGPYRQRLELYQAHKPYHLAPQSVSTSSSK